MFLCMTVLLAACTSGGGDNQPPDQQPIDSIFIDYSTDQINLVFNDFWANTGAARPYAYINDSNQAVWDATLWDYSALFTATIRYHRIRQMDDESTVVFNRVMEGLDWYRSQYRTDDYLVYASQNGNETPAFYDDNVWIVLGFIDAYHLTGEQSYLDKAIEIQEWIYTGWVDNLENDPYSGGLLWREYPRDANGNFLFTAGTIDRNACINGPAAMASALLYQITGEDDYLDWAVRIYDWTVEHLRTDLGLYYDRIVLESSGNMWVDETVYSYNTGTMISAGVYLYEITGDEQYLTDASQSALTYQQFKSTMVDSQTTHRLYLSENEPWFRVYLFLGFMDLARVDNQYNRFIENSINGIKALYETGLDDRGYLLRKWGTDPNESRMRELRHISGNLEALTIFGEYEMFVKEHNG